MRTNRPIVEKQKLRPNACRAPSAYRSPIISNAHGGMWRTPPAYISAVRFLLDKSKYIADINSSMVPPMGEGHERRAMNVNEKPPVHRTYTIGAEKLEAPRRKRGGH